MATFKDQSQRDFRLVSKEETQRTSLDFNKIKVGNVLLRDDVFLETDYQRRYHKPRIRREDVERAIDNQDIKALREISNY